MQRYLATKTLQLIEDMIAQDQGARFREELGKSIKDVDDAYDNKAPGFRSHFGVSTSGEACARKLWYNWRWVTLSRFSGRMLRLFNRGHLEEARFVAMLRMIGCNVFQTTGDGKQFRITWLGGHYGSAIDGVVDHIPDLPNPGDNALAEFKTHNNKSFIKLETEGLLKSKPKHYAQMVQYMKYWNLPYGLYLAVNKDTDALYGEIILRDDSTADHYYNRSRTIILAQKAPPRYGSASDFECRFCDHKNFCHYGEGTVSRNCRTCVNGQALESGVWVCAGTGEVLSKEAQIAGCDHYDKHRDL